jgi:hypothetical protein
MSRTAVIALVSLAGLSSAAMAQTNPVAVEGVSFLDRAARGEITLGRFRGSIGVIDYDRDGFRDLFILDVIGQPKRLFRNVPSSTAPGGRTFVDVTSAAGLNTPTINQRGFGSVVVFDYNNDGWPDIFSASTGGAPVGLLLRNNTDGTFTDVTTTAGLQLTGIFTYTSSAADFDHDGNTDLLVVATSSSGNPLNLLRNNGNGTFTPRPDLLPSFTYSGITYAHAWTDYDHDGWEDVLVLPNRGVPLTLKNVAGPSGGRQFIDATTVSGFTSVGPAPMGIALGDINNDGWIDVAITDASSGTYFENRAGTLTRVYPYATFFGWGTSYIDADNDTWLDNYQAGSFGSGNIDRLLRNRGNGTWADARTALNTTALASQYSARVDFDNDGREDLITVNPNNFVSIYHNQSVGGNWSTISLGGGAGVNSDAVGAVVRLTAGGITQVREVAIGTSYSATEDTRPHFGLGAVTSIDRVEVIWPRAGTLAERTETFYGPFDANTFLTIRPKSVCPVDLTADGRVDFADFLSFFNAYDAQALGADIDGTGSIDFGDFLAFFNGFDVGC